MAISRRKESSGPPSVRISWQGQIESVQCRAWVWRYKLHNRTHHHIGFNLFLKGKVEGREGKFIVAISDTQHAKQQFRIGDVFSGTAWTCIKARHDIADYYRTGGIKGLSRSNISIGKCGPPFIGLNPRLEVYEWRGARMLNAKLWRKQCFTCMWANKSAVEIEYNFGKVKRYRKETFCYGPKTCPFYDMGQPRPVQYFEEGAYMDTGWMDRFCTERREDDDQ